MKKSSFIAMIMGTVSGVLFAIGMCMALLPEWKAFNRGIMTGCAGIALALITVIVWRRMEHKPPVRFTGKTVIAFILSLIGALAFGAGMCLCMVWERMVPGIVIGLAGMMTLLSLIPLFRGIE